MSSRAEHKRKTLLLLSEVAIAMCEEDGFGFTIEAVAARAQVSARTVHRYVPAKEDLFFVHFRLAMQAFERECARVHELELMQRVWCGIDVVSAFLQEHEGVVRRALKQWLRHPELMRGYAVMFHGWVDLFTAEAAARGEGAMGALDARVFGCCLMGVIDASMGEWVGAEGRARVVDLVEHNVARVPRFSGFHAPAMCDP
ncbi:MAG: helix-turn-helix domain-containing protein [Myxococcota bacterium]